MAALAPLFSQKDSQRPNSTRDGWKLHGQLFQTVSGMNVDAVHWNHSQHLRVAAQGVCDETHFVVLHGPPKTPPRSVAPLEWATIPHVVTATSCGRHLPMATATPGTCLLAIARQGRAIAASACSRHLEASCRPLEFGPKG